MNVGDRVKLVKATQVFDPGARGVVSTTSTVQGVELVAVDIDTDENGESIDPFPLPPLPADEYFEPEG